ncbi:MAG: gamma-glutamyltransferase [Flavobacteriales bacterium]|nr:gamma-glutamyltransferase [Flavobacteriales bacterium]
MVVCAHPVAARIGREILQKGGNAVDAAVAVQAALAVCYPNAGNLGGGGFMVLRWNDGRTESLDFREKAPQKAHEDMFLDGQGYVIPELSLGSGLSSGVPGSVDGWAESHRKYGKLSWQEVIQPAIDIARNGFHITAMQAHEMNSLDSLFRVRNPQSNYFKHDQPWVKDDLLKQEDLAQCLERIRDQGRDGFYTGETAKQIIQTIHATGGIMTDVDLNTYQSVWRQPVIGAYKGRQIISMPPPSSGGIVLLQMLTMLEDQPLTSMGFQSPDYMHMLAEVERLAYADRAVHLGDPDYWDVPQKQLLDPIYLKERVKSIKPVATSSDSINAGVFIKESEQTTHLSIVDKEGNAVAVTTTLNASYGSKIFVKGCGFLLNNEMDDFSSKPGVPNLYGLTGGRANAIKGGKRMLSSMTPTIILKEGKLHMVLGSPGGSTIITSVMQTFLNVEEFGMSLQEAIDTPRFHHQWIPDEIQVEQGRFSWDVLHALEARGHNIYVREPIGRVDGIMVRADGKLEGAADPRGDDKAEGF